MPGSQHLSRRTALHLLLGALFARKALRAEAPTRVSDLLRGFSQGARFSRRYRVDATVLLLGMPIITRQNVGGAFASIELGSSSESDAVALQFAAGSWPERARGLNRFGIWREAVIERGAEPPQINFAGFMTDSREKSFEEARSSLVASNPTAQAIMARGHASSGAMQTWVERIDLPAARSWTDASAILSDAIRRDPSTPGREAASGGCASFLYAVRNAGLAEQAEHRREFCHGGKTYTLETHRRPEEPLVVSCVIRDQHGARCSEFQNTYAAGDGSGLPTRIQYRPRSFLRLTFESQPEAVQPPVPWVFEEAV
jgi:hypothetical protein